MRPKASGLVQHGGLPGWLEESESAGSDFYVMDGPYHPNPNLGLLTRERLQVPLLMFY
jgi:hypothetical protein